MDTKVKICGVRTIEAAEVAIDAGADFLGFNFVPTSKRFIDTQKAKEIIEQLNGAIDIVGVFQNEQAVKVNEVGSLLGLDFVQLHGDEDNSYISKIDFPVIKAITTHDDPEKIKATYLLLDREIQGQGEIVDLKKAASIAIRFEIFLAGGLNPENVAEAIEIVKPFAVDVAAGIETNGVQDLEKIKLFIERVKSI